MTAERPGTTPQGMSEPSCDAEPGRLRPVVDHGRCEAKTPCVVACPYDVFTVRRIEDADFAALSFIGRLRSRVHGRKTAYADRAEDCRACGDCVTACPEKAIKLMRAE